MATVIMIDMKRRKIKNICRQVTNASSQDGVR